MKCFFLASMTLGLWAQTTHDQSAKVEQNIGGIHVGERLGDVKHAYPKLTGPQNGVWSVGIGRNCILEVVTHQEQADDRAAVEVVTLTRIDSSSPEKDERCDAIRTGAGLRFGAALQELERVYNGITLMEPEKEPRLYRLDNGPECLTGRTPILRSMFVYWSTMTQRITSFSVDASVLACREYRDTAKKH